METSFRDSSLPPAVRTLGFSWPLLVALLAWVGVLYLAPAGSTLGDPDTYWHIAAGRWIVEHGAVPQIDPFSHSMPGAPWTAHEWLSELVLAGAYRVGGWSAVVCLAVASFAATLAGLTRFLLARMEPVHALLCVALTAGMLMPHLLARPHVLMWPLVALWVGTLVDASESGRHPPWWLLSVMLLWANLHGSFTLGLALGVALACDAVVATPKGARRSVALRWLTFVALSLATSMITPSGWGGILHTAHVLTLSVSLSLIGEWSSPNFHKFQTLEIWLLLVLALALMGRVRLPLLRVVIVLGLVHLALKHQRNVSILGLVAPYLMAAPMARHWYATATGGLGGDAAEVDRWFRALAAPARLLTAVLSIAVVGLVLATVVPARLPAPKPQITPAAALAAARAAGIEGNVLNAYNFGGFLILQGVKVFIDGRADMYGDDFMKRNIQALSLKDGKRLPVLLDDYRIAWTLLEPGTPAVALLDLMPGWQRVHADDVAVVHRRLVGGAAP